MGMVGGEVGSNRSPIEASFTTLPWNGGRLVRSPELHMKRLRDHVEKLGLIWPSDFAEQLSSALETLSPNDSEGIAENEFAQPSSLLRVEVDSKGVVELAGRPCIRTSRDVSGIAYPAPRYSREIQGLKHADWKAYYDAGIAARESGADMALLVHQGAVIDGDRATPMLLDHDGVAWVSDPKLGGVHSTTLELLLDTLERAGIPLHYGRLTEVMFARAREVVMVGSGVVAVRLTSLDGEKVGSGESILQPLFQRAVQETGWTSFEDWIEVVQ